MADLIVALDLPSSEEALGLVDRLGDTVGWYKVGSPLFTRSGPPLLGELAARGKRIFLDLKFHDIPSTVAGAVESAASHGVDLLTVHSTGGTEMLQAAAEAAGRDGPRILAVTILTSFTPAGVEEVWNRELLSVRDEVSRLGDLAAAAGVHGVVCSPLEAELMRRRHGPDFLVVTPGVRPADAETGDQARVATPEAAARAGADYLVVGRPIWKAADPVDVVKRIRQAIAVPEGV
ncbi:MAG: orotidine-5'-phosphate decarboxylase [Candidatus Cloacimonetes bacterium]|nr:orotidine-5'-phosphate decarboxylase [Candidatus Cloacimonadota bacterium]